MYEVGIFRPLDGPWDHSSFLTSFARGVKEKGDNARVHNLEEGYQDCDVAVVFGLPKFSVPASWARGSIIYEHRYRRKKNVLIMERGFIKRDTHYGVALNGLNGLGDFGSKDSPADRWNRLGAEIKPWRPPNEDGYFLLCGQVPWDATVQHTKHAQWCQAAFKAIQGEGHKVRFRPHPDVKEYDYGLEASKASWEEDLDGANAVVTFSSTSSALAVLEGIPIFALDRGSIAYQIANQELSPETLAVPGLAFRDQWAWDLAYSQWTEEEMAGGQPWEQLRSAMSAS